MEICYVSNSHVYQCITVVVEEVSANLGVVSDLSCTHNGHDFVNNKSFPVLLCSKKMVTLLYLIGSGFFDWCLKNIYNRKKVCKNDNILKKWAYKSIW